MPDGFSIDVLDGFPLRILRAAVFQGFNACINAASLESQWQVSLRLAGYTVDILKEIVVVFDRIHGLVGFVFFDGWV